MKLAIITDTHWGVRNDHPAFIANSKKFLNDIFFPYIDTHNITHIIHAGDLVDRRKYININTARSLREDFLDPICDRGIFFDIIAGNHDTYFKNTNGVNSLSELVRGERLNWHINPFEKTYDGTTILLLPWICDENRAISLDIVRNTNATICVGHLELEGYEMYKGTVSLSGDNAADFGHFDAVLSGHFHHKSSRSNIHYLGSHGQFTWSDYEDERGFHILDTETKELRFIENPNTMFAKVWYDDRDKTIEDVLTQDFKQFNNKMVKVIVTAKTNLYWFDKFIEQMENCNIIDMQVVEDHHNLDVQNIDEIIDEAGSTIEIITQTIEQASIPGVNKIKLQKLMEELHAEALSVQ